MRGHGARLAIRRPDFVFTDMTVHADPADLAGLVFAEPEFAVAHHQRKRAAARRETVRKFSHRAPPGVMRPMRLTWASENHTFPSGPATMPSGPALAVGRANSVIAPDVVIRPILLPAFSQNHNVPSAADVMPIGRLLGVGVGNSVKAQLPGFNLPILDVPLSPEPEVLV